MDLSQFWQPEYIDSHIIPWSLNILSALIIFVIGRLIAKGLISWLSKQLEKSAMERTLISFIGNILYATLLIIVIIAALNQLGIDTTSLLAVFAAASLAVGLALKDSLSNFASGVLLILFRPFKQGDFIEAGGTAGIVEQINIFNTIMRTGDNREVIVPNSQVYGGTIVNYSARETRRIDLIFGIGYDDDIRQAKALFEEIIKADQRILTEPECTIAVSELADHSVNFVIRPWVKSEDYWAVRFALLENLKLKCDETGISIPYPQRDVHIYNHGSSSTDDKSATT